MTRKLQKNIFIVGTAVLLVLRLVLKLTMVDPLTGFYTGSTVLPGLFFWLTILVLIALLVLGWVGGRNTSGTVTYSKAFKLFTLLAGATAIACAVSEGLSIVTAFTDLSLEYMEMSTIAMEALISLVKFVFLALAPLVSGIAFIAIGAGAHGDSDGDFRKGAILMLVPVVWQVVLLLVSYMQFTSMRSVSDQQFGIVLILLHAPYLLAFARIFSGIDPEKGCRQLAIFGLPFSCLAIVLAAGSIVASFAGHSVLIALSPLQMVYFLFMGLGGAVLCLTEKTY